MKDVATPVSQEEVRAMIKSCLETAAHINYQRLASEAKLQDDLNGEACVSPSKKMEDLINLATICVDLLQQNEEHYSEVLIRFISSSQFFFMFVSMLCVIETLEINRNEKRNEIITDRKTTNWEEGR